MKKIKKALLTFSLLFLLGLSGCNKNIIDTAEVIINPSLNYKIGEDLNNAILENGKIKITYKNKKTMEMDLNKDWIESIDIAKETVKMKYLDIEFNAKIEGFEYIDTVEKLIASQTNDKRMFIVKAGTYEVDSLRYEKEICLIGDGTVKIITTSQQSNQAGILILNNATLSNIEFQSNYETSLISALKIGKIETDGDVPHIDRLYMKDVISKGGKGLNIMAVSKGLLDNVKVEIDQETKNVALAVSAGSTIELKNSNIAHGTWGSIAIFGVQENSNQEWYKRKTKLTIKDTTVSGAAYIEYFSINNSEIIGLENWTKMEENDYRVYTK